MLPWPGADTVYRPEWIHDDAAAIADAILTATHDGTWEEQRAEARRQVRADFDLPVVCGIFADLVAGKRP